MRFFGWLFLATLSLVLMVQLRLIDGALASPDTPWGIVGFELAFTRDRAAAIIAAMTERTSPKVRDVGPNQFVLTARKGANSVLVCYLVEDGQPVVQFIYDHKAQGVFEKVVKILGSKVHDLADATAAKVLEFTNATTQDCA